MPVFHLFPSDVVGDGIGVVYSNGRKGSVRGAIGLLIAWRACANLDWNLGVANGRFMRARRDSEMVSVGSNLALNLVTWLCVISLLSLSSYAME